MNGTTKIVSQASAPDKAGRKVGRGCLTAFALPFAAGGVFALVKGVGKLAAGDWREALALGLFGLVFGGVGLGLMIGARYGARLMHRQAQLKASHPDSPWLWREDWASGQVKSSNLTTMIGAWVFALLWNGISSFIFVVLPQELAKGNKAVLVALVFPLVGVGLLIWAARATLRWRRYGHSIFRMTAVPGVIGGPLAGVIQVGKSWRSLGEVHLRLVCVRRVRSGKSTTEHVLWEDEKSLRNDVLVAGSGGIPVYFFIPYSCQPTSEPDQSQRGTVWRLEAQSQTAGIDYAASFEVPVFKTDQSDSNATSAADPTARFQAADEPFSRSANSRVQVRDSVTGGREFIFPAAGSAWVAFSTLLFLLLWGGAIWLTIHFKAPIIFPVVLSLFGLLICWGTVEFWFKDSRVCIDASGIVVRHRRLGLTQVKRLSAAEVAEIKAERGMQSGQTVYYGIRILTTAGRQLTAVGTIPDKREAEWLAQQMTAALKSRQRA